MTTPTPPAGTANPTKPVATLSSSSRLTIERLSTDQIVTVDGRVGLFTPLTAGAGTDPTSTDNLQAVVDVLRKQVADLQSTNAGLTAQLAAVSEASTSSDEFASGVQHSLDVLQDKLATMENSVSTFAVREFSMQSKVLVDVSDLGTIGLRFVKPGEDVESTSLSTVSITVVPLPKEAAPASGTAPAPTDPAVDEIDGLSARPDRHPAKGPCHLGEVLPAGRHQIEHLGAAGRHAGRRSGHRWAAHPARRPAGRPRPGSDDGGGPATTRSHRCGDPGRRQPKDLVRSYAAAAKKRKDDDGFRPTVELAQAWIDARAAAVTAAAARSLTDIRWPDADEPDPLVLRPTRPVLAW